MPKFSYTALDKNDKPVDGNIEATDRHVALERLKKDGLKPVGLHEEVKAGTGVFALPFLNSRVKAKDLVIFTRQLSTMVGAGVPLIRSLITLQTQSESKKLRQILDVVLKDVQGGMALGDAFAKHPEAFSDVYVNMVRAGEA